MSGFFFDSAFGLFAAAPIWMLLVPAVGILLWRRHALARHLLVFALPCLALVAPRSVVRRLVAALPLCAGHPAAVRRGAGAAARRAAPLRSALPAPPPWAP
jgi:hypothetical protein